MKRRNKYPSGNPVQERLVVGLFIAADAGAVYGIIELVKWLKQVL